MFGTALSAGLGALGGFMGGSQIPDYSQAANQYANNMSQLSQNMNPYIQGGQQGQNMALDLARQQMDQPAALQNQLAEGFVASPYQNQMQLNLSNMMNTNAANTGMLGSTSANAALQNQLAEMQNQFMNQYIDRGTQMYGLGSQGMNQMATLMTNQGFTAQQISDQLQAQGYMAQMQGQMMPTQQQSGIQGAIGGALGAVGGGFF